MTFNHLITIHRSIQLNMSSKYLLIFSILAFIVIVEPKAKQRKLVINWDDVSGCSGYNNKISDLSDAKVYMANETAMGIKGMINVNNDIDSPIMTKAYLEKAVSPGNYMMLITYDLEDLCKKMDEDGDESWTIYFKSMDPPVLSCPIKKGRYDVSKITPDKADVELKKEMIGAYRCKIELYRPSQIGAPTPDMWACYTLQFNIDSV